MSECFWLMEHLRRELPGLVVREIQDRVEDGKFQEAWDGIRSAAEHDPANDTGEKTLLVALRRFSSYVVATVIDVLRDEAEEMLVKVGRLEGERDVLERLVSGDLRVVASEHVEHENS